MFNWQAIFISYKILSLIEIDVSYKAWGANSWYILLRWLIVGPPFAFKPARYLGIYQR